MAFYRLCEALDGKGLLANTLNMSVKEQVLMFLQLVGYNERFRAIRERFLTPLGAFILIFTQFFKLY